MTERPTFDTKEFKGVYSKEDFTKLLSRIDSLKMEGYYFTRHKRRDFTGAGLVEIDYKLIKDFKP